MEIAMFVQSAVIEQQASITAQQVAMDVKDSSVEVSERITRIHVGEFNCEMSFDMCI